MMTVLFWKLSGTWVENLLFAIVHFGVFETQQGGKFACVAESEAGIATCMAHVTVQGKYASVQLRCPAPLSSSVVQLRSCASIYIRLVCLFVRVCVCVPTLKLVKFRHNSIRINQKSLAVVGVFIKFD